ncbi:NAD-dependent epimerase/dehydratase family protein [Sinorhizobium meliloti]|nr:NAD-dependent epimerase/dehydratase family protein [Sinorhizobium meliloti]
MKALVTGSTGCLGRNVVERLITDGHDVVATGRNSAVGKKLRALGADFRAADIADVTSLMEAAKGCDTVFHCAALASPWGRYEDFHHANVRGTSAVISAVLRNNAALVHVSTPSIYFDFRDRFDIDEYDPLPTRQANHYAATKLEAETLVDAAVERHGIAAITLRPRAIFGPYDTALFPRVLAASANGRVPLVGFGNTLVDVSCVSNVVDAMLLAGRNAAEFPGRKYNITNGEPVHLRHLLALAFERLGIPFRPRAIPYPAARFAAVAMEMWASSRFGGKEPRLTPYTAGVLKHHQTLSIRRAVNELGYRPRKSTFEGVIEYANWRLSTDES